MYAVRINALKALHWFNNGTILNVVVTTFLNAL